VRLDSHVAIEGATSVGEGCRIYPFASVGLPPQDLKYKDEDTRVVIGSHTVIREFVSIHRASVGGDGVTSIGERCFLMAYVHVAHDCRVGNHVIMANNAALSGHVLVEDHVVMGGIVGVHQFVRIGAYSMVGGFSRIVKDVPPYVTAVGTEDVKLYGLNKVGLKRKGFSEETLEELRRAYQILFREKLTLGEAIKRVQAELPYTEEIGYLIGFIQANKRGVYR
jgi:UDP-N-acetylglucosamine acyltransferase